MSGISSAGIVIVGLLAFSSFAQDAPKPKKFKNVSWYTITHVDYFPHQAEEAIGIVFDHFVPAAARTGNEPARILEYATGGAWDVTVIFPMTRGPAALEWEVSPETSDWLQALAEEQGDMDKAQELLARYRGMINRYETHIVRERQVPARSSRQD